MFDNRRSDLSERASGKEQLEQLQSKRYFSLSTFLLKEGLVSLVRLCSLLDLPSF